MEIFIISCLSALVLYLIVKIGSINNLKDASREQLENRTRDFYLNKIESLNNEFNSYINSLKDQHHSILERTIQDLKEAHNKELKDKLEKTRVQTRAVNFGLHAQHTIVPLLAADKAGISNKEIRWFGDSIDFICFKGLDEEDGEVEIVFADAKTSKNVKEILDNKDKWLTHKSFSPSKFLNKRQKRIVDAIKHNRLSFQLWMADDEGRFDIANFGDDDNSPV